MKRVLFFLLGILLAGSSVLIACGQPSAATGSVTAGLPKQGGTIRMVSTNPPVSLDPVVAMDGVSSALAQLYSCCLLRWTGKNDSEAKLELWLAEKWDISADSLVHTIKIREGVKFQNLPPVNGREVTAEDVKFTIERVRDPKTRSPYRSFFTSVQSVEVLDKYTIRITMKEVQPGFQVGMAGGAASVCAREVIEQDGKADKTIVGCGPFILEENVKGVKTTFRRNPDYFEKGKPYADRVEFTYVPDEAQRVAAFRAGELDRMLAIKASMDSVIKSNPQAVVMPGVVTQGVSLAIGLKHKPDTLGKAKVRQAVRYAIDYEGLINAALDGAGYRTSFLGPTYKEWGAPTPEQCIKRDVGKAKQLLAEAGLPNGFKTSVLYDQNVTAISNAPSEPLAAQLKEVGINMEIKPADVATQLSLWSAGEVEFVFLALGLEKPPDPDNPLFQTYYSKGSANLLGYANPRVDELIMAERKSGATLEERKRSVKEILDILEVDVPFIPLYITYRYHLVQPWIKGWDNPGDPNGYSWAQLPNIWIER